MSYQVIARKWRPQTFEEVTGQEHITRTLRGAIEHERLHHAYLFSGARGVGKTTTARLLAKAVNCHKSAGPTPTPCAFTDPDACPSCQEIAEGRSIDVLEIDAASNTGVDNVRDAIINTVGVRPARDRYKVFIIDEVHMLSGAAFNALLKTLEEPPPRVLFIMATTESHKVPDTILSRCQQFEFRTIATAKIAERLRLIAKAEKVKVSDEALGEIARAGEGSMRDAQSAFDQVISFSEGGIEVADVETALGLAGGELLARVMRSIADARPADSLAAVGDLASRGHDLRNFCRDLLAHVRDLLVLKVAGDGSALADATDVERKRLADEAKEFSESDLVRFFHSLTETEKNLRESAHPRYQLEIGLVKLVEMRRLAPLAQLLERLDALEETLRTGRAPAPGGGGATPTPGAGGNAPRRSSSSSGGSTFGGTSGAAAPDSHSAAQPHVSAAPRQNIHTRAESSAPVERTAAASSFASAHTSEPATPPDLSGTRAGDSTPPATSRPAPAHAGLKLVAASERREVSSSLSSSPSSSSSLAEDEPPFPVEGAVRAPSPGGNASASASFYEPPAPPSLFNAPHASADGTGARLSPSPAPSFPNVGNVTRADAGDDDILSRIKQALDARRKPFLAVAIEEAKSASVGERAFDITFTSDRKHLRDMLAKPDNLRLLQEVCRETTGRELVVNVVVRDAGQAEGAAAATVEDEAGREKRRLREHAESQPEVQELLRAFRGEIVDVQRLEGDQHK